MSHKILLVGSSAMDLSLNITRLPDPGETTTDAGGVSYAPGGGGANAAVALAKLGAISVFVTRLGKDLYGQKLYNYYREAGIDTSFIKIDSDFPTGFSVRIKEADGKLRTVSFPGANEQLAADTISEAFSLSPDAVYLNFESSFAVAERTAKIAAARGVPLFVDASPANANFPLERLPYAEIFSLGANEAYRYTGIKPTGTQEALRAALNLWRKVRAKYIVINMTERGAVIYDGKRCESAVCGRGERIVDKDASGDAFSAALCIEYMRCGDIKRAAAYAAAAGVLTASKYGSSTSVPSDSEVREYMHKNRF